MNLKLSFVTSLALAGTILVAVSGTASHQPWVDPATPTTWTGAGITWPPATTSQAVTFTFEHDGQPVDHDPEADTFCGPGEATIDGTVAWSGDACMTLHHATYELAFAGEGLALAGWWQDGSLQPPCTSGAPSVPLARFAVGGDLDDVAVGIEGEAHGAPYLTICV